MHNTDFIAFDTETGGLDSATCALLSIAAVPSWDAPAFHIHVLPVGRVEKKAAEVNGYTPELWEQRNAVTPKHALFELRRWLCEVTAHRRYDLAAHNAGFDALFLLAAQARTGIDLELPGIWHCTKIQMQGAEDRGLFVGNGKHHLDNLGQFSGFWNMEPRSAAHDALQDARCCKHGLLWLRNLEASTFTA